MLKAKFRVSSLQQFGGIDQEQKPAITQVEVKMDPVISSDKESENYSFSKYTPSGLIQMTITNPAAFPFFEPGVPYIITFERATEEGSKQ